MEDTSLTPTTPNAGAPSGARADADAQVVGSASVSSAPVDGAADMLATTAASAVASDIAADMPPESPGEPPESPGETPESPGEPLTLTDFLDLGTLQEIQDAFSSLASVRAHITDADGRPLTQSTPTSDFLRRQRAIAAAEAASAPSEDPASGGPSKAGREYVAPIVVNNQRLGLLRMTPTPAGALVGLDEAKLAALGEKFHLDPKQLKQLLQSFQRAKGSTGAGAAIQFLYVLANAIARLCYQEYQLRQRINELTAVYNVSTMLADARDLGSVLARTARVVCDVIDCKAASIRLVDEEADELVIKAVHNLSPEYLGKGPIRLSQATIDHVALGPKGYEYVRDMAHDPRVRYPKEAEREGITSMISIGMRYKGKPVGVLRLYTENEQTFSQLKIDLLKAVAAQAAAAIENARLLEETLASERLEKQVRMAADVQQRMIPSTPPPFPAADLAAVYVPCYELGGDFYDFITLGEENVGLVVADVSGKGVAASLIMAAVRAALRAQADNVYYLYEVVRRINVMLCRDTLPQEFVTLFYGVLDAPTRRLTYTNAGHPPPIVLREGKVIELGSDDMVLGIDEEQTYRQHLVELHPGDTMLIYTDGLTDAMNYNQETFGRVRVLEAFKRAAASGTDAEGIAQSLLWDLRKFVGISKRTDDVTMIVARIK